MTTQMETLDQMVKLYAELGALLDSMIALVPAEPEVAAGTTTDLQLFAVVTEPEPTPVFVPVIKPRTKRRTRRYYGKPFVAVQENGSKLAFNKAAVTEMKLLDWPRCKMLHNGSGIVAFERCDDPEAKSSFAMVTQSDRQKARITCKQASVVLGISRNGRYPLHKLGDVWTINIKEATR